MFMLQNFIFKHNHDNVVLVPLIISNAQAVPTGRSMRDSMSRAPLLGIHRLKPLDVSGEVHSGANEIAPVCVSLLQFTH